VLLDLDILYQFLLIFFVLFSLSALETGSFERCQ